MKRSERALVGTHEAIDNLLTVFLYAEQLHGDWKWLEEELSEVEYEKFDRQTSDWYIEYLMYCIKRAWNDVEDKEKNRVSETASFFKIENYTWKMYKHAKKKRWIEEYNISLAFLVNKARLSEDEIEQLRSKCK